MEIEHHIGALISDARELESDKMFSVLIGKDETLSLRKHNLSIYEVLGMIRMLDDMVINLDSSRWDSEE